MMTGHLNNLFVWVYRLLAANFYFVVNTFKGFIILGLWPSLLALYSLCHRWLQGDNPDIKEHFAAETATHKKEANILGYAMFGLGLLVWINLGLFSTKETVLGIYLFYFFILLAVFWIVSMAVLFAIHSQFELPRWHYLRLAVLYPIAKILYALLLAVLLYCLGYLQFIIAPPLGIFLGFVPGALLTSAITSFSWRKERKALEESERELNV